MNAVIGIAVAICFGYLVVQIVAIGQLTGERRLKGIKYLALAFLVAWFLIDWLLGATGWVLIEGIALIVAVPFAVAHLAILLVQESRQG